MIDPLFYAVILFFAFWVLNHSDLLAKVRATLFPALPGWLATALACPICFTFWTTGALCLFWYGFLPALLTSPVFVLFLDLAYRKLKGDR